MLATCHTAVTSGRGPAYIPIHILLFCFGLVGSHGVISNGVGMRKKERSWCIYSSRKLCPWT